MLGGRKWRRAKYGEIRRNTAEYGEGSALELEWFSEGPMFEGAAGQRGVNVSHVRG